MKKRTRLAALLLALLMMLSMSGCGSVVEYALEAAVEEALSDYTQDYDEEEPVQQPQAEPLVSDDGSFHQVEGNLTAIEINQGLGIGVDEDTGEKYYMNAFVSQKETVIFAHLEEAEEIDTSGQTQYLKVYRDGELIATLAPNNGNITTPNRIAFTFLGDKLYQLTAGKYTFEVTTAKGSGSRCVTLRDTDTLWVLAVPVRANYGGRVTEPDPIWKTAGDYSAACYPLSKGDYIYELGSMMDLSDSRYDLYTDEGMYYVWQALAALQTQGEGYDLIIGFVNGMMTADQVVGGYTYGAPANIVNSGMLGVPSTVAHEVAHCYLVGDEYNGGSYNFEVNTAPYGFRGSDWYNRSRTVVSDKEFIVSGLSYGYRTNGSVIHLDQNPYNWSTLSTWDESLLPTCFMGGCDGDTEEYWITSAIWEQLYKCFTGQPARKGNPNEESMPVVNGDDIAPEAQDSFDWEDYYDYDAWCPYCYSGVDYDNAEVYGACYSCWMGTPITESPFTCGGCGRLNEATRESLYVLCGGCGELVPANDLVTAMGSTAANSLASGQNSQPQTLRVVELSGLISPKTFEADPFFLYQSESTFLTPATESEYYARAVSATGTVLARCSLDASFVVNSNPPKILGKAPVNEIMACPEGTAAIEVFYQNKLLKIIDLSDNVPEITDITAVANKESITVTWQAKDADGQTDLAARLWYIGQDDTLINLGSYLTDPYTSAVTIPVKDLPGCDSGSFCLMVSDGVNTAQAYSKPIAVEYKAPEVIGVKDTLKPVYKNTEEILITLNIYDKQDGWLQSDSRVVWLDENGLECQSGNMLIFFPYELSAGEHTYTCVATNSKGLQTTFEVSFAVEEDTGELEGAWYAEYVQAAMETGFVMPLDKLETTGINRQQMSRALANLYTILGGEVDFTAYDADAIGDILAGTDNLFAWYAVEMGWMDAADGLFDPLGTITEQEALQMFYNVLTDIDSASYPEGVDLAEIEQYFIDMGIVAERVENPYDALATLMRDEAFVRYVNFALTFMEE
ncbi:MAG: hypothetical protein J6B40_01680 [Oscillospiraceae bacterium]|nr:hypothetical protein [Oscillospiraceae bacterium]